VNTAEGRAEGKERDGGGTETRAVWGFRTSRNLEIVGAIVSHNFAFAFAHKIRGCCSSILGARSIE
jgi:hypothetical protein